MDKTDNITVKGYYCHTGKVPQEFKNRDELISELENKVGFLLNLLPKILMFY